MIIVSRELTTSEVKSDGSVIQLNLEDIAGNPVSIQFSLDQAESIAISFPELLSRAIARQTNEPTARYVFPIGLSRVERTAGQDYLMITLATLDGFEVTFRITIDDGKELAATLKREIA